MVLKTKKPFAFTLAGTQNGSGKGNEMDHSTSNRNDKTLSTTRHLDCGRINLDFVCRFAERNFYRGLIVGFHIGDEPLGRMVFAAESELLQFPKFQLRVLEQGGPFAEHCAASGSVRGKQKWNAEIANAIRAGSTVDPNNCDHKMLGDWN